MNISWRKWNWAFPLNSANACFSTKEATFFICYPHFKNQDWECSTSQQCVIHVKHRIKQRAKSLHFNCFKLKSWINQSTVVWSYSRPGGDGSHSISKLDNHPHTHIHAHYSSIQTTWMNQSCIKSKASCWKNKLVRAAGVLAFSLLV